MTLLVYVFTCITNSQLCDGHVWWQFSILRKQHFFELYGLKIRHFFNPLFLTIFLKRSNFVFLSINWRRKAGSLRWMLFQLELYEATSDCNYMFEVWTGRRWAHIGKTPGKSSDTIWWPITRTSGEISHHFYFIPQQRKSVKGLSGCNLELYQTQQYHPILFEAININQSLDD
jgi:hypothetical protein